MGAGKFSIVVEKEDLKFSAAHFIAYPGFREPLHGHNYRVGVRVEGALSPTGYVLDFGVVKEILREIVKSLDEKTLLPGKSDCLTLETVDCKRIRVRFGEDEFVFPVQDVRVLPIVHSSAEELAQYICSELTARLKERNELASLATIEVSVAEAPGQMALYREVIAAK